MRSEHEELALLQAYECARNRQLSL